MTDRTNFLTVVLDKEYRDDDAQQIIDCIKGLRGVIDVGLNVASSEEYMAIRRAKIELYNKIGHLLYD